MGETDLFAQIQPILAMKECFAVKLHQVTGWSRIRILCYKSNTECS